MYELRHIICQKRNVRWLLLLEIVIVVIYGLIAVASFSAQALVFDENDMQLKQSKDVSDGNYLDISFEDTEAVITPVFQVNRGIYFIEASFATHGIIKAGLIYDNPRKGNELVNDDEFILNPEKQAISYRVRINDDSKLRFKLRLTGDAVEGDYIQLFQVRIASSKLTYVYYIFRLAAVMILADLILWGYVKYYVKWEVEHKMVFLVLTLTSFFISLPLFQTGLSDGKDLTFHLSRLEGIYNGLKIGGGGSFRLEYNLLG